MSCMYDGWTSKPTTSSRHIQQSSSSYNCSSSSRRDTASLQNMIFKSRNFHDKNCMDRNTVGKTGHMVFTKNTDNASSSIAKICKKFCHKSRSRGEYFTQEMLPAALWQKGAALIHKFEAVRKSFCCQNIFTQICKSW